MVCGCAAAPTVTLDPRGDADRLMVSAGFEKTEIAAGDLVFRAYTRLASRGEALTVYIEGDGLAWKSRSRLSEDPTPIRPTVLRLAAMDPSVNTAYLARPGQYLGRAQLKAVDPAHWSDRRFAEEVVHGMNAAVSELVRTAEASGVRLVGYSGGGAVAALIAARRTDVESIRTVAGNLDPEEVNRIHRVSPLTGSLSPMDEAARLARIPQIHYTGAEDKTVPPSIAERFKAAAGESGCITIRVIEGAGHEKGWLERWASLISEIPSCSD